MLHEFEDSAMDDGVIVYFVADNSHENCSKCELIPLSAESAWAKNAVSGLGLDPWHDHAEGIGQTLCLFASLLQRLW